ncbi:MAG: ribonuclease HI family protein [bacterium]
MGCKEIGGCRLRLVAYIDGSSAGNPGEAGYGIVLKDEGGKVLKTLGRYLGLMTNNAAEYEGLIGCLELAAQWGATSLAVYSDSELIVNQMNGTYRVRKEHLRALHDRALTVIKNGSMRFSIKHISREMNKEADGLARRAVRLRMEVEGNS